MHAYVGTGEEILNDKAGRDEFRCDILETPTRMEGVGHSGAVSKATEPRYVRCLLEHRQARTVELLA